MADKINALIGVAICFNRPELVLNTTMGDNLDEQWDYVRTWMRDNARYFYLDQETCTYQIDERARQQAQPVDWHANRLWEQVRLEG